MKKINFIFGLGVSILFVFLGYYLYFEKSAQTDMNPTLVKVAGVLCMLFFGVLALLSLKKIFSK